MSTKITDTHAMAHTAAFRFPSGIPVPGGLSARCSEGGDDEQIIKPIINLLKIGAAKVCSLV
jgi:hypothetical protein